MNLNEALQKYLEEMVAQDDVLRSKYNPEKMDQCCVYVTDEAKKYLKSRSGAVEDSIVFKWARDFFIEILQEEEKPEMQDVQVQNDDESAEPQEEVMDQIEESEESVPLMENAKTVQKMSKKEEKEKEAGQLFFDF